MAALDFPASPTVNQKYSAAGVTWTWDGTKWVGAPAGGYLPLAGGAMTGDITLKGDPIAPLNPVTKQMFDARPMIGDTRIINGDMRIDQRNNGASSALSGMSIDRWYFGASQVSKLTWGRNLNAISGPVGFPYYFGVQSSSAYASIASDTFQFIQQLEGDAISDFAWGTTNAQPVTLSFWAYSSMTGTFGAGVRNYTSSRSYPFTYSIPTANTWTKIAITIPGDTIGAWVMNGNAGALVVCFDLGSGSTYRGPANVWASATYLGATGTISLVGTNAATFYVTGVKLEVGSVATPFNRQSVAKSLADCQRYYFQILNLFSYMPYVLAGTQWYNTFIIPTMRISPTLGLSAATGVANSNTFNAAMQSLNNMITYATAPATGQSYFTMSVFCSAEL